MYSFTELSTSLLSNLATSN